MLECTGQARTATNLFLAMIALLSLPVSSATNCSYWAYIPNPPINRGVHWWDSPVPIYVNESSRSPGPHDIRGPLVPSEEGTKVNYYEVGVEGLPICIGYGTHCLKSQAQAWLSIVKNSTWKDGGRRKIFILQGHGFKGKRSEGSLAPPDLPPCQTTTVAHISEWVHWEVCRGECA